MNMFPDYESFLEDFRKNGYSIAPLTADKLEDQGWLYLRHDIDFDCRLALEMAELEARLGVRATYFFMLCSDSYNLLSEINSTIVKSIKALGHKISIHFDPVRYRDFEAGLRKEISVFESFFQSEVDLISLHRPNDFFLSHDKKISGTSHTYQSKYLNNIKYVADSRGSFRYGSPFETDAFRYRKSIHLLIHPIWWMMPTSAPQKTLDNFVLQRVAQLQEHVEANCVKYYRAASSILTKASK